MDLDTRDTQDLAEFFARRFPDAATRQRIARRAGLAGGEPEEIAALAGWLRVVTVSATARRLPQLARAARHEAPEDDNLAALGRLLGPVRVAWQLPAAAGALAAVALLAVGALWSTTTTEVVLATAPLSLGDPPTTAELVATGPAGGGLAVTATDPALALDAAPEVRTTPVRSTSASTSTARAELIPAPTPTATYAPAHVSGRCTAEPGEVVGYWYAGSTPPGAAGALITMTDSRNVRAAYPTASNGYDARTPIRCVLRAGDRVRLSQAPLPVDGGHYWVPLVTGDLRPQAGRQRGLEPGSRLRGCL